jgi:hypothetical protein
MISLALMLMTLPSRMAEVRARHGESSSGQAARARLATASSFSGEHGEFAAERADRDGLPDSSREGSGGSGGERLDKSSSAARDNASLARTGSYNKER